MRKMFEASVETTALVDFFKPLTASAPISWSKATKAVGFPVSVSSSAYTGARKIAERDHGIVIATVRGFGFVRLTGEEMVGSGNSATKRIRRLSKRMVSRMILAIENNLDENAHDRATNSLNRFRVIHSVAEPALSNRPKREPHEEAEKIDRLGMIRQIK